MQSWLDHKVFDVVNKRVGEKMSSDESSRVVDAEVHQQSQGTPWCLGISRPGPDRSSSIQPHTFCTGRGLDLTVRSVEQVEVGAMRHQHEGHCHIFILPLDDVRDVLKPTPESMLRLRKAVYGLVNAPKKCLDRLDR